MRRNLIAVLYAVGAGILDLSPTPRPSRATQPPAQKAAEHGPRKPPERTARTGSAVGGRKTRPLRDLEHIWFSRERTEGPQYAAVGGGRRGAPRR